MKSIKTTIKEYLSLNENYDQIEQIIKTELSTKNNKIQGGFLNKKQSEALQREIESNYSNVLKLGPDNNDIRTSMYNYDHPFAEKNINGVSLKITQGLVEGEPGKRRTTWLLYADEKIIGKFYSPDDIKTAIKYIEDSLMKKIEKMSNIKTKIKDFLLIENENKFNHFYTTSIPMNISEFIEIEVEERENYDMEEVEEWVSKYNITDDTILLWVATSPHIAARYQMMSDDWDNAKEIYEENPNDYNVITIDGKDGIIIEESEDGDDGYLMILSDMKKYNFI